MDKNIFISYCWSNKKDVDDIDLFFLSKSIELHKDERKIEFKQSIKEFMKSVRKMDYVIQVISDEYLKSENCMYEVLELLKDDDYKNRILPIIIDNTKLYERTDQIKYIQYWNDEMTKLEKAIEGLSPETIIPQYDCKKRIQSIQNNIMEFIATINDMKHFKLSDLKSLKFQPILKEMNLDGIQNKSLDYEILEQEDISHPGAKRYSVKLLVSANYKRSEIKLVIDKVIEEIKPDNYYRNELVKNQFGDNNADIVIVFVYYRNSDVNLANHICRAVWNSESLTNNDRLSFNTDDMYKDIEIDWNNNYQEDISMYRPATKGKYLNILDEVEKEISALAEIVISKIEQQLSTEIDFTTLGDLREKYTSNLKIISEKKENIPLPPLECEDLADIFEGVYIFLHNIFIWISEKNLSERSEHNISYLLKQEVKNYNDSFIKFQRMRKSI